MAEDLAGYYTEVGVRCRYMHSEIETLERVKLLAGLRKGEYDVLIGINLLREGLDLPEVSLVAILDADKEGFLRSAGSLIQTMGRAARHIEGRAILYADRMTDSMQPRHRRNRPPPRPSRPPTTRRTASRRSPSSAQWTWASRSILQSRIRRHHRRRNRRPCPTSPPRPKLDAYIAKLETDMREAAKKFEFEKAARLRDTIKELRDKEFLFG